MTADKTVTLLQLGIALKFYVLQIHSTFVMFVKEPFTLEKTFDTRKRIIVWDYGNMMTWRHLTESLRHEGVVLAP